MNPIDPSEIETSFVSSFIEKHRRERVLWLLSNPRRRSEYLNRLNHSSDRDVRFMKQTDLDPEDVIAFLKKKGSPSQCYIISDEPELDSKNLLLVEAVDRSFGCNWGTVICCIPDRLGFYTEESSARRYILERNLG